MTDKVFPSSKPTPTARTNGTAPPTTNGGSTTNQSFPATKAQLYNATRPAYRPTAYHNRRRRSRCCTCCLWTTLVIIIILALAALSGAVLYVLYRPHRPTFTLSSLQLSQFNLTSSNSQLTSKFNLTVTTRNPNKKITFIYNPIDILISSNGVNVGTGSFPAFTHGTKNTTTLRTTVSSASQPVDETSLNLKNKKSLPLKIQLDTKVKVKIGGMKTKKVGIRVKCSGIKANLPTGKTPSVAATAGSKCKVDLRIKIWKVTF